MLHLGLKPHNMMWHDEKLTLLDFSLWEPWPCPEGHKLRSLYCTEGFRAPEVSQLRRLSQRDRRLVVNPALDWWSLGCTAAILAWATLAEPPVRPKINTSGWHDACRRDQDINRVAPRGAALRPVLEMLLHHDPEERSSRPVDFSLIGQDQETASWSSFEQFAQ